MSSRHVPKWIIAAIFLLGGILFLAVAARAAESPLAPVVKPLARMVRPENYPIAIRIVAFLTVLSLAPYLIMMMTSFVRIAIVLSFIRSALGTQQVPPTQVLMGLALFLTMYLMAPVSKEVNQNAIIPLSRGKITELRAMQEGVKPVKGFMLRQVRSNDLELFYNIAKYPAPKSLQNTPLFILVPAFMVSEVKTGFEIGFLIYLPFLIIDMVVASVLMSMGMFMLSPLSISLPFKLLLFVMADGWELIIKGLILSFH